ncbi:MAG: lipid A deacylase LpxR family protein [Polaribacter sp.]
MKYFYLFLCLFSCFIISAQEKFSKEISLITDNDLYISLIKDRYYTSGIFLNYKYLAKNNKENIAKRIIEWEIGHEMYTPHKPTVTNISQHDRPFAGYLYAGFGVNRIYKSNKILNTSLQVGVIGPNSYAKELQVFIHNFYEFREPQGWEHQIKNAFALNFQVEYKQFLFKNTSNHFDMTWLNEAKVGTVNTKFSTGFLSRIGFLPLQNLINSVAFDTSLNNENTPYFREAESFFYIKPTFNYTLYDATLQGSFLNTTSDVTKELVPFVFNVELGIRFTVNRFNFGYAYMYHTNKSEGLRYTNGTSYGQIIMNYLIR